MNDIESSCKLYKIIKYPYSALWTVISVALLASTISSRAFSSTAEHGYVPPGGVNAIMGRESNGYDLEALVKQNEKSADDSFLNDKSSTDTPPTKNTNSVINNIGSASGSSSERKKLRKENRKLKDQLLVLQKNMTELQKKVAETSDKTDDKSTNLLLTERLKTAEDAVDALTGKVHETESRLADATAVLKVKEQKVDELENKIRSPRGNDDQVGRLSEELQTSKQQVNIQQAHMDSLKSEVETLKGKIAGLQGESETKSSKTVELSKQLEESRLKIAQLTGLNDAMKKDVSALATVQTDASKLREQLAENQSVLQEKEKALDTASSKIKSIETANYQLETKLSSSREQLKKVSASGMQTVTLDTAERKQAYVVGQAMAAMLRERLHGYTDTGVKLDIARIIAGLGDGLRERMQMKKADMDDAWQGFAKKLQVHIAERVKEGEVLITSLGAGRKPLKTVDGIVFYTVKKGKPINKSDAPRTLALREASAADNRTISQMPSLTLGPDDDMPSVIEAVFPLLGPGSDIEAFAMARAVYGDRALPKGIAPYTVLKYELKGLSPQ